MRALRHDGERFENGFAMKPRFHIANPAAPRSLDHGMAACGLVRPETAYEGFFPLD